VTKASIIAEELRASIARGVIPQGARLYQDELAQQFATSITPVREALRQLEAEGLLEGTAHKGVKVSFPGIERIESLYVIRRSIESFATLRAALRISRGDMLRAEALNDRLAKALEEREVIEARRLNHDFHFVIYRACDMPTLIDEIERLWSAYPWSQMIEHRPESVEEHRLILEALSSLDREAIESNMIRHITGGFETVARQVGKVVRNPFDFGFPES
jgi:DNA-binding GntR family transcriptional regulator